MQGIGIFLFLVFLSYFIKRNVMYEMEYIHRVSPRLFGDKFVGKELKCSEYKCKDFWNICM